MSRVDIAQHLVHFTRGDSFEEAFQRLRKILADRVLLGGTGRIKGKYACVCFSEAPINCLSDGLVNESLYSKYSPFGIVVSKEWLFSRGGRPVIYQPADEWDQLQESHRWRHVLYEIRPDRSHSDFTWEREWRILREVLEIEPSSARVVVPDRDWRSRLIEESEQESAYEVAQLSQVVGHDQAELYRTPCPWTILPLR